MKKFILTLTEVNCDEDAEPVEYRQYECRTDFS